MKILGENSLSSKTERGLKILFGIIAILDIFAVGIASVTLFSEFSSFSMRENYLLKLILEAVISFVFIMTGIVALFIIYQFIKIFRNLRENKLFEKDNLKYLNRISVFSLIIGVLYLICFLGISIFLLNYNSFEILSNVLIKILILVFALAFLIFGIGIKILTQIYQEAIKYKEENDFTI